MLVWPVWDKAGLSSEGPEEAQTASQGTRSAHRWSERKETSPASGILCASRRVQLEQGEGDGQSLPCMAKHSHPHLLLQGPRHPESSVSPAPTVQSQERGPPGLGPALARGHKRGNLLTDQAPQGNGLVIDMYCLAGIKRGLVWGDP